MSGGNAAGCYELPGITQRLHSLSRTRSVLEYSAILRIGCAIKDWRRRNRCHDVACRSDAPLLDQRLITHRCTLMVDDWTVLVMSFLRQPGEWWSQDELLKVRLTGPDFRVRVARSCCLRALLKDAGVIKRQDQHNRWWWLDQCLEQADAETRNLRAQEPCIHTTMQPFSAVPERPIVMPIPLVYLMNHPRFRSALQPPRPTHHHHPPHPTSPVPSSPWPLRSLSAKLPDSTLLHRPRLLLLLHH